MERPRSRSRGGWRRAKAVALTLIAFIIFGSGAGLVQAAGDDGQVLPMPLLGDSARYAALGADGSAFTVTMTWLEPTLVRAQDGSDVAALRLLIATERPGQPIRFHETSYAIADGGAVSDSTFGMVPYRACVVCVSVADEEVPGLWSDAAYGLRVELFPENGGPCGVWTAAHGSTVDGREAIDAYGSCGDTNRLHRLEDLDLFGAPAVGFGNDVSKVWYVPGIPFPARAHILLDDHIQAQPTRTLLEMVEFQPGTQILPPVQHTTGYTPAPLPLAPLTEWTLDEAGAVARLPIAEVVATIEADPVAGPSHRDFLASAPGAYIAAARYQEVTDSRGHDEPRWLLLFTDGTATRAYGVHYYQVAQAGGGVISFAYILEGDSITGLQDSTFPPPGGLPAGLPRLVDIQSEFMDRTGADAPPPHYGFVVRCTDEECSQVAGQLWAGEMTGKVAPLALPLGPFASYEAAYEQLIVDIGGNVTGITSHFLEGGVLVPGMSNADDPEVHVVKPSRAPTGWAWPENEVATGAGVLAVLLGVLYYLWPALKATPMLGLFSRIQRETVLEHPSRRSIERIVTAEPGIHFQELQRRTGMARGVLGHHVQKLVTADRIVSREDGGYRCLFPKGTDRRAMAAASALKSPGARAVFDYLAATDGAGVQALSDATGLSLSTVSHHLSRMKRAGIVTGGGRLGYELTEEASFAG